MSNERILSSTTVQTSETNATADGSDFTRESLWARVVGSVTGALAFALCVLLCGAVTGLAIAIGAALVALARGAPRAAILFAISAAICAIALAPSTVAIFISSIAFGEALARASREHRDAAPLVNG